MSKKRKGGPRNPWYPTDEQLHQACEWMKSGGTIVSLAKLFGVSKTTLFNKMNSDDIEMVDENGQNKLKAAIETGQAYQADFVEGKWMNIIRNDKHRNHYAAVKDWYLNVIMRKEPTVIVVNEGGQQVDKSPEEIAKMLKDLRSGGVKPKVVG